MSLGHLGLPVGSRQAEEGAGRLLVIRPPLECCQRAQEVGLAAVAGHLLVATHGNPQAGPALRWSWLLFFAVLESHVGKVKIVARTKDLETGDGG